MSFFKNVKLDIFNFQSNDSRFRTLAVINIVTIFALLVYSFIFYFYSNSTYLTISNLIGILILSLSLVAAKRFDAYSFFSPFLKT